MRIKRGRAFSLPTLMPNNSLHRARAQSARAGELERWAAERGGCKLIKQKHFWLMLLPVFMSGAFAASHERIQMERSTFNVTSRNNYVGLMVIGEFLGERPRPYYLWIKDSAGRISGWLPDGTEAESIPKSSVSFNPFSPSDPEAVDSNMVPRESWPFAISINDIVSSNSSLDFTIFLQAIEDTDFSVNITWFMGGGSTTKFSTGTLKMGEVHELSVSPEEQMKY
jgi:hypothetical protein